MSRTTNTNYTAAGTAFQKATVDGDAFDANDLQLLAEAVDGHTHADTRGLPVQRLNSAQANGDTFYATSASAIARLATGAVGALLRIVSANTPGWLALGTANQVLRVNSGATDVEWGTPHAVPALTLGTTNAAGTATTAVRTDATILAFDATIPAEASSGASTAGSAATAARRDHVHGHAHTSGTQDVATSETTTSTSYTDLATSGPAVTLSPGATRTHLIIVTCRITNDTAGAASYMSVAIAGAAAADADGISHTRGTGLDFRYDAHTLAASQASGATHTAKYRVSSNTGTFSARRLSAAAL